ncbi:hypothetical protein C8R44DRAFT_863362 [Mycena epipterygia]|nr:hypothetical protein C8R44DRAFT_863362 [Mycena epipterygia]
MYLWPDIAANISSDTISEDLGDATELHLRVRLPILEYRHVTSFFLNFHGNPAAETEEDNAYDLLAHHSSRTARQRYGVDRMALANASTHHIIGCIKAAIKWQDLTRISGAKPLRLTNFPTSDVLLPDVADQSVSSGDGITKADVVAIVAEILRVRDAQDGVRLKEAVNSTFAEAASIYFPPPPPPRPPYALRPASSVLVDPSRLVALRKFLRKDDALFRCAEQGELLEKIQTKKNHILAVLACDFGKTTMIMLNVQQFDPHLVTLVILPITGLVREFHRRAVQHDIKIGVFNPANIQYNPTEQIVYVSIEFAGGDSFIDYAVALQNRNRLARIFIDEIHILMTAAGYREAMAKFFKVLGVNTQLVGLSASVPVHLYPEFCEITGIDSWDVIRMATARPTSHMPSKYAPRTTMSRPRKDYGPKDKAMVFCRTKVLAAAVAEILQTQAYTSDTSEIDRTKIFGDWVKDLKQIIVCTSILGPGVDQEVRDIVHVNMGWNMIDQFQEDNRAGRNRRQARSIYFIPSNIRPIPPSPGRPFGTELLVPWALNTTDCRRIAISLFLDGFGITCIELGGELCANCLRKVADQQRVPPSHPIPTPLTTFTNRPDTTNPGRLLAMAPPSTIPETSIRAPPVRGPPISSRPKIAGPHRAARRESSKCTVSFSKIPYLVHRTLQWPRLSRLGSQCLPTTITDLRVSDGESVTADDRVDYIVAEDKRSLVWLEHQEGLLMLLQDETSPVYPPYDTPPGEIYVQMQKHKVFYGKLFSPSGVMYVRRGTSPRHLEFSRIYDDLDGDVRRTACLIIQAAMNPTGHHSMATSTILPLLPKIWSPPINTFSPGLIVWFFDFDCYSAPLTFLSKYIGAGASGDVWRSSDGAHVIKIFENRSAAQNEAEILSTCQRYPGLAVPTFCGLYSDGLRFGVVTSYAGTAICSFRDATRDQRQQLLRILLTLHRNGIHHHDVRPANVMLDKSGILTLIDFDRAKRVDGECTDCTDLRVMSFMEALEESEILPYEP